MRLSLLPPDMMTPDNTIPHAGVEDSEILPLVIRYRRRYRLTDSGLGQCARVNTTVVDGDA